MGLDSGRWWLRTFHTSLYVSHNRSGKCERAGSLSKRKVQNTVAPHFQITHKFCQQLNVKFRVTIQIENLGSFVFEHICMAPQI